MERRVHDVLTEAGLPFEEEYEFPDLVTGSDVPLRFDFAVFDDDGGIDFLIEANGAQHYKPVGKFGGTKALYRQQYNDCAKKRYCQKNHYPLVVIPYWDAGKITYDYIMRAAGYS